MQMRSFDTLVWGDGQGGEKVRGLFEQAERNQAHLSMSVN